jgi:hypothetical protein
MLELLVEYFEPMKKISIYILIIFIIFVVLMKSRIKSYVIENKNELKNNPLMVPLISYFDDGPNKVTFISAIKDMIYAVCKSMLEILLQPYYMVIDGLTQLFKSITGVVNQIRKQIRVIRNMLFKIFDDMYTKIEFVVGTMTFLFLKIREILKKTYAMSATLMYTVQHSFNFLLSITDPASTIGNIGERLGDSGWLISTFALGFGGIPAWTSIDLCFSPDTLVVVNSENKKMIDVNIGDKMYSDTVIAKLNVSYTGQSMYKMKDIIVSGGHAIEILGRGIRIKDIFAKQYINCEKLDKYEDNRLICFVTDTGYIQTKDGTVFRDYLDTSNKYSHISVKQMVMKYLNGIININTNTDTLNGIILDDKINIINSSNLLGDVEIDTNYLRMFKLRHMNDNTLYSSGMLILYNDMWICVCDHPMAESVNVNKSIAYNWIMKDNIIELSNGIKLRDFIEVGDEKFNEYVSEFLLL